MDLLLCFLSLIISISSTSAYHHSTADDFYDYTHEEDTKVTKSPSQSQNTPAISAKYEVIEDVDDVPNPNAVSTFPVATNFTPNKPLNIAGANRTGNEQTGAVIRENPKFRKDFANTPVPILANTPVPILANTPVPVQKPLFMPNFGNNKPGRPEFELGEEYDDGDDDKYPHHPEFDSGDDDEDSHEDFHHFPHILPVIKRYLHGLEKGIISGLNGIAGKDVFKGTQ